MKTIKMALATLMLMTVTFCFVGCSKDDEAGGHKYVDLGLPSGTLWATCNVGADTPEGYGDYFAWGETASKTSYEWINYKHSMGTDVEMLKYCTNAESGLNGYTDGLLVLEASDDAATAKWGRKWRMPTYNEWEELHSNTTRTITTQNGVKGMLFTGANGNSIFMPCAGTAGKDAVISNEGKNGFYWSNLLHTELHASSSDGAMVYAFPYGDVFIEVESPRCLGLPVRPVIKK